MAKFTLKAQNSLNCALTLAREMGHTYIGTEHLLCGILSESDSAGARLLEARGVTAADFKSRVLDFDGSGEASFVTPSDMTPRTKKVIELAAYEAMREAHGCIGTEHLLLAIAMEEDCIAVKLLENAGVAAADIRRDVGDYFASSDAGHKTVRAVSDVSQSTRERPLKGRNASIQGAPTISQYGKDLCAAAKAKSLDPMIGRKNETERVIQILSRRTKNNPCLIGEPGVGKTAVVEGLAQRIVDGGVPEALADKIIVALDLSAMIAGSKFRGEFEERMKNVMNEAAKNPSIILFIDELHNIIGAGAAEGAVDAANIIKPALARGEMQVIGATTVEEYRRHIEKDAALERRFQSVTVNEPSPDEAVLILKGLREKYEAHHKVKITDEAIDAAVGLSARYINDRFLPDKAIDLIDEACSRVRTLNLQPPAELHEVENKIKSTVEKKEQAVFSQDFEGAARLRDEEKKLRAVFGELSEKHSGDKAKIQLSIGREEIAGVVTQWTGIPLKRVESEDEESERLAALEQTLKERVIGQHEAVSAVARAIRRGRTGLKDPRRPIGSFIFLGPTGVGKTELCRVLADVLFGSEKSLIRVDMSEYMEKYSVSKMIGSPPGYVGYDDGGQLTERVRRHPYSVVLFDEIEKAHPDVFNIMLQILDDGSLTDSAGRRVDFRNTVIIMTSNAGASSVAQNKRVGFGAGTSAVDEYALMKAGLTDALKSTFRPEFLNRIDEVVVFDKLSREDIRSIASLLLEQLRKRVGEHGITLEYTDELTDAVVKSGFDPVFGARPLRRAVVRLVEDALSEAILSGEVCEGDSVMATFTDGRVVFEKA